MSNDKSKSVFSVFKKVFSFLKKGEGKAQPFEKSGKEGGKNGGRVIFRSLQARLLIFFLALSLIPLIIAVVIILVRVQTALSDEALAKLNVAEELKAERMAVYFEEMEGSMSTLAETISSLEYVGAQKQTALMNSRKDQLVVFYKNLITRVNAAKDNPDLLATVGELTAPPSEEGEGVGETGKSSITTKTDLLMKIILSQNNWDDLVLIDTEGVILYSANMPELIGKDIPDSELADTSLGKGFAAALEMTAKQISYPPAFGDFFPYPTVDDPPAAFIVAQIRDNLSKIKGYVAFQVAYDDIKAILNDRSGMGTSGEFCLAGNVGGENLYRSNCLKDNSSFGDAANGLEIQHVLAGESGSLITSNANNQRFLTTYTRLDISGMNWGILANMELIEVIDLRSNQSLVAKEGGETDSTSSAGYFDQYIEGTEFKDLMLIDASGFIFYSVKQGTEYNTNILTGEYSDTNLAGLVEEVLTTKQFGFADFEAYAPGGGDQAAFLAKPILENGKVSIVVALQLTKSGINQIVQARSGMGETGESFLVSLDGQGNPVLRSDMTITGDGEYILGYDLSEMSTEYIEKSLNGESGSGIFRNAFGNEVIAFYQPLDVFDTQWGIISTIDVAEARAPATRLLLLSIAILAGAVLTVVVVALLISRTISKPVVKVASMARLIATEDLPKLVEEFHALANGDLTRTLEFSAQEIEVSGADEISLMANGFNGMVMRLREAKEAFMDMTATLRNLISQVAESANRLSESSSQLSESARHSGLASSQIATIITQVTQGTATQAESVNHTIQSVEQMGHAIDGVARGAQEQAVSVGKTSEITMQLNDAIQNVAANAVDQSDEAAETVKIVEKSAETVQKTIEGMRTIKERVDFSSKKVQEMGDRSKQIGAIVETIEDIASQTNLLALNAAIEAARAGEHGKGFAVVADEVRKLAEKSAQATREISQLVVNIEATVSQAIGAMKNSADEVEKGVTLAAQADSALEGIKTATESSRESGMDIAAAANKMRSLAEEMINAMNSVSAVVEENTAATEQMSAFSSEVSSSTENIAAISEENSASMEEVSASVEEMNAQVEDVNHSAGALADMAQGLQELVAQFKISSNGTGDIKKELDL